MPELIGLIIAFGIMMPPVGALGAGGMPILGATIGVTPTLMGITAVASVLTIASASTTVALMLGLSCGIDYGLFILSRHRTNLLNGMTPEESVPLAMGTAGSSVVFAALTVIIALCGLTVVGIPFLTVMGLAAAASVTVALLIALTLLPALLGFAGPKVASFTRLPLLGAHAERVARRSAADPDGVARIKLIPEPGPGDAATARLVHTIREDRAAMEGQTGAHILVGGTTASNIDVSAKLSAALPIFLIVVVGLAFILLTFAFRTILVPIKSILGFLLSMAAALGAQVAMFQWCWGQHLFGITPSQTISFLPIIMLAIIFGLSSDYEVFVVSRIKEEYTKNGDARRAVQRGTGVSARVVTAAALIMFSIFVAFMFTNDPTIKAIGFSFAAGVFLDAFVVRLTLVPAVMAIVRSRLWYHPEWFARYIPDPDIEGQRLDRELTGGELVAAGTSVRQG